MRLNYISKCLMTFGLFVLVALAACNSVSSLEAGAGFVKMLKDPSVKDINQSIKIELDGSFPNQLKPDGKFQFTIFNQSRNQVYFTSDRNAQLFAFSQDKGEWQNISNKVQYIGEGTYTDPGDIAHIPVRPVLESSANDHRVRVVITGYIVKDGQITDEPVSAYKDVILKP